MPLRLHVFEDRYRRMISECLRENTPFGVVLIKEGPEVGSTAIPESVGTIARIHALEPGTQGSFDLLAEGASRFRITDVDQETEPYLIGTIEMLQDDPVDAADLQSLTDHTRSLFKEYFDILIDYAGVDMPEYELPDSAEDLSFVMAAVVQAETAERQSLLEMTDTAHRLRRLQLLLTGDIERLRLAAARTEFSAHALSADWKNRFISRN